MDIMWATDVAHIILFCINLPISEVAKDVNPMSRQVVFKLRDVSTLLLLFFLSSCPYTTTTLEFPLLGKKVGKTILSKQALTYHIYLNSKEYFQAKFVAQNENLQVSVKDTEDVLIRRICVNKFTPTLISIIPEKMANIK